MLTPRWYQQESHDAIFEYLKECKQKNKKGNPIVVWPTGAGKSLGVAMTANTVMQYKNQRVLILIHTKELVQQNYDELVNSFPHLDVGIYSAGLNKKEIRDVTVASIQSVGKKSELFKNFTFGIVDECHLVNNERKGMYRNFLEALNVPVIGFTASPFRLKGGYLHEHEDSLFTDIVYDLSEMHKFNRLVEEGYLCRLKSKRTELSIDISGVRTKMGDFDQTGLSAAVDKAEITKAAVLETIEHIKTRKACLVFAIDIEHCEHIKDYFVEEGISADVVHSKTSNRDQLIESFKAGQLKVLINCEILTTGFNYPELDTICLLRPTKSPVIHVQTIGRGLRIAPNKTDCLILDFAQNVSRLGPINDIKIGKKRTGSGGKQIVKECPECGLLHHPTVKFCDCGHEFIFKIQLTSKASTAKVVKEPVIEVHPVDNVKYTRHKKKDSPDSVKVTYYCGLRQFNEWIPIEHEGYAKNKALQWLVDRNAKALTVDEVLYECKQYPVPKTIVVDETDRFPRITKYGW
jgi:DNA repair protein RadD